MAYVGPVSRWDVFWVDLEPHVGSEQAGERRPVIVISNNGFNEHFDVVTILPLTKLAGKRRRVYAFEVLAGDIVGDGADGIVMPHQVRTISKLRLLERVGSVTDETLRVAIEERLLDHLGIEFEADTP